ncbi:MAG TPA: hypothetical protein VM509_15310 [Planctomycetota bacterium]|nr:hypothetical protein [Planctomycetota bacterium]
MEAPTEGKVVRERPGCVLGIALGIMVLGSLIALLWLPRTEKRDGALLLRTWLGIEAPPAGYEVRDAQKFIGGEEVVQLVNAGVPAEKPRAEPEKPKPGVPMERVDWARLALGPADRDPLTLLFVHYPAERARGELGRLFSEKLSVGRLDEISPGGGRMVLELGTLTVGDTSPAYVLERVFEPGGTFKDIARVDFSSAEKGLIVNAEWSRSEPFSKSRLQALLGTLRRS